jgi:small subunit ribosomal protein S12
MARITQLLKKKRPRKKYKNKRPNLKKCPQKKATCLKVYTMTPRKPNSAIRKIAWVALSNYDRVHAYIPGMGVNSLQKYSVVLVRGGRVKDLPGMKYTIIRGKFDLKRIHSRRTARSKFGAKKIYTRVDHRYKKYIYW